ncbi:copper chaperone for superoxide dismutase, chloroplastic isoform X2 [Dioscorea cayenensis subsp. rotundata]|uniref:Superoxide dismutase copper chaperone n=1 Tax=Dioscorea cayennensis subsp. rotundata TaxID=55577 RepID=A0AB40CHR2_DIOCR|nr:copper chaperone for superoxide dismutase, chloroplastic isoform X2 [Dioscorea cayenensis subsp. rotundata]
MVAFLRTISAATAIAAAAAALSSSSSSSSSPRFPIKSNIPLPSSLPLLSISRAFAAPRNPSPSLAALRMDSVATELKPSDQEAGDLPELLTEFMVDMKCEGCVSAVKNNLLKLKGVKNVDADLSNQVVRVLGSIPLKNMVDALEQTGRKAKLIGQGSPDDFLVSAAVAEFKGPDIYGVVRLAQVNMELARIEASFSGLSPGQHAWSINEFGDLTKGAASTGKEFNPAYNASEKPLGDLGTIEALETGEAHFSGAKEMIRVADLIGRAIVVYGTEDKSVPGIAAAVIARSAGVGENYKKICTCDGVTIWEST